MKHELITLAAMSLIIAGQAQADTLDARPFSLVAGGGAIVETGIYTGANDQVSPLPLLELTYGRWTADLDKGLGYNLIAGDRFTVSAAVAPRFAPDFPDAELFSGMDRATAAEAGLHLGYDIGPIALSGSLRHDMSGVHNGMEAEVKLAYTMQLGPLGVETEIGARFLDEGLSAHLYGVAQSEANEFRTAYAPGSSWSPKAQLTVLMPISGTVIAGATASYEDFAQEIENSPLISATGQSQAGIFLLKAF